MDLMLTTLDNPYNPFTQFGEWYAFDTMKGYRTCELLDNYCYSSTSLSDVDILESIKTAIEEIVQEDVLGIYIKVTPEFYKTSNNRSVPLPHLYSA